jgi:glycosyltransferase involved in cell wall biosynthesis
MTGPAISVLVTTYNHERWVLEALDSLRAQSFEDYEVIITDDCSSDRTVEVIRAWLERTGFSATLIINDHNKGIAAVRNAALEVARGEFVCSLSGDDCYHPQRLELQHAALTRFPAEVAGIFSDMRLIDPEGQPLGQTWLESVGAAPPPPPERVFRRLLVSSFLPAPATMVRRDALNRVGRYDESLVFEDYDMWLRLSDQFELRFVAELLVDYRIHPESLSRRPDRVTEFMIDVGRVQVKWRGRHSDLDWANARRLWAQGRHIMTYQDATSGRRLIELAYELVPTPASAFALELDWAAERLELELAAERERHVDAAAQAALEIESLQRVLDESELVSRRRAEILDEQAAAIDMLLASRWLKMLDVLERPMRKARPGLGSVRTRLRKLRDHIIADRSERTPSD